MLFVDAYVTFVLAVLEETVIQPFGHWREKSNSSLFCHRSSYNTQVVVVDAARQIIHKLEPDTSDGS